MLGFYARQRFNLSDSENWKQCYSANKDTRYKDPKFELYYDTLVGGLQDFNWICLTVTA